MDTKIQNKRTEKVSLLVSALVAGAHSLYTTPIVVNKKVDSKISRLPLLSWVNTPTGRYFVIAELAMRYSCSMTDVAYAIKEVHDKHLAYVDSVGVDVTDLKGLQDILEIAFIRRTGDLHYSGGGTATASLGSNAKLYIRDLKQPKPTAKGQGGSPVIVPDWLLGKETVKEPAGQVA